MDARRFSSLQSGHGPMVWTNRVIAGLLILSVVPLWTASDRFPGTASTFPRFLLIVITVLAAIMLLRSFIPSVRLSTDGEGQKTATALLRPFAVFVLATAAVWLMTKTGFFPAMVVLGAALYPLLNVADRKLYVIGFLTLLVFVFSVFVMILNVPLMDNAFF